MICFKSNDFKNPHKTREVENRASSRRAVGVILKNTQKETVWLHFFLVCYLFIKVSVTVVTDDRQTYNTIPDTPAPKNCLEFAISAS